MSYFIKNVVYGITGGPLNEVVVATIEFEKDDETSFLSIVDVEGIFSYYLSKENIYDKLINEEYDEIVEASEIMEYNGIDLSTIIDDFDVKNDDYIFLIYALLVLRLDEDKTKSLINDTKNRILTIDSINKYDIEEVI